MYIVSGYNIDFADGFLAFGYCRCLRLWVDPSVCQSRACPRDNSWPVQARLNNFGPNVQNTLMKDLIVFFFCCCCFFLFFFEWGWGWGWAVLGVDLDPQDKIFYLKFKFYPILSFKFVRAITHHPFKPVSPNLDQRCKTTWLRYLLFFCFVLFCFVFGVGGWGWGWG